VQSYFSGQDTTGVKARADQAGVKPPEEMDKLRRIYLVKECSRVKKDGKFIDVPLDVAATIAKSRYPEYFGTEDPAQKTVSERERLEQAVDARRSKAREVPTSQGGEPQDPDALKAQALDIMEKKMFSEMSDGEKEIIAAAYRKDGCSEEQIKYLLSGK